MVARFQVQVCLSMNRAVCACSIESQINEDRSLVVRIPMPSIPTDTITWIDPAIHPILIKLLVISMSCLTLTMFNNGHSFAVEIHLNSVNFLKLKLEINRAGLNFVLEYYRDVIDGRVSVSAGYSSRLLCQSLGSVLASIKERCELDRRRTALLSLSHLL